MQLHVDGFERQDRGPYLFDVWQWPERVKTALGDLVVELITSDDEPPPDVAMVVAASEVADYAIANGEYLLDLVYGHYRYAEEEEWLEFWGVPAGLGRDQVLSEVESATLSVRRDDDGMSVAYVFVDPHWDPEHKLDLICENGRIVAVNDDGFVLDGDVLRPCRRG
jgi:hypothetical protein